MYSIIVQIVICVVETYAVISLLQDGKIADNTRTAGVHHILLPSHHDLFIPLRGDSSCY